MYEQNKSPTCYKQGLELSNKSDVTPLWGNLLLPHLL
nr:MAG TPA: hypothetical protein [Crassvirales sp.]DAR42118.1 MAG TPA: hypothetical protein [Crassvirales sp.]